MERSGKVRVGRKNEICEEVEENCGLENGDNNLLKQKTERFEELISGDHLP